jgi:PAP2 superfamily
LTDRKQLIFGFLAALLFVTSEYFADNLLRWTASLHPKVLDLYLFSFDSSLRVQLSTLMGKTFARWPALRWTGFLFYIGLPIPIALIFVGRLLRSRCEGIATMFAFLITGPAGIVFYNLFPALGPAHLFQRSFPWNTLSIDQASRLFVEPIAITGPPNAIPSLHMAWVLLTWWYSRGLSKWERGVAFAFLIFTLLATLGSGEHYFIDLIVAFPFALMIESVCSFSLALDDKSRAIACAFGLLATIILLILLHYSLRMFWVTPILPWALCFATVAVSLFCERRLQEAVKQKANENAFSFPGIVATRENSTR